MRSLSEYTIHVSVNTNTLKETAFQYVSHAELFQVMYNWIFNSQASFQLQNYFRMKKLKK